MDVSGGHYELGPRQPGPSHTSEEHRPGGPDVFITRSNRCSLYTTMFYIGFITYNIFKYLILGFYSSGHISLDSEAVVDTLFVQCSPSPLSL